MVYGGETHVLPPCCVYAIFPCQPLQCLDFVSWGQLLHEETWAWGGVDFGRLLSIQTVHMPSGEPSFLSCLVSTLSTASVLPHARPVSTSTAIFFMVWFLLTRRVVVCSCSRTGIWCIPHAGTLRWFCSRREQEKSWLSLGIFGVGSISRSGTMCKFPY